MHQVLEKVEATKQAIDAVWPTPYGYNPPLSWTQADPNYMPGDSVVISPQAQFKAYSHDWETYHIGTTAAGTQQGWQAQPSPTSNRAFNQGEITTLEGVTVLGGVIPVAGGHAGPNDTADEAQAHYDNTKYVRVAAVANDTEHGCQLNGFVLPGTTFAEVAMMRLTGLSGDWRWFPQLNALDYIGACFVPRQGLPKGVVTASAAYGLHDQALFQDRKAYSGSWVDGKLRSVTASHVETIRINTMNIQEKYETPQPEPVVASTGTMDGEQIDLTAAVKDMRTKLEQLELMVLKLQSDNETIEEIDQETPDS